MNRSAMSKPFPLLSALFLALSLTASLTACGSEAPAERPPLEDARIGGPFTLTDKTGHTVHWTDFDGKYRIVYFGYTFCPDACPLDVGVMMKGFSRFEKAEPELAAQVRPIFISIDPARDTPKVVGEFTAAFHPRLLGLTGTAQQVDHAARAFAVYYARGQQSSGGYLMDHSRAAYLMGRDGKPVALLPVDQGPDAVEAELAKWVK